MNSDAQERRMTEKPMEHRATKARTVHVRVSIGINDLGMETLHAALTKLETEGERRLYLKRLLFESLTTKRAASRDADVQERTAALPASFSPARSGLGSNPVVLPATQQTGSVAALPPTKTPSLASQSLNALKKMGISLDD
jgi:hypothetical protein